MNNLSESELERLALMAEEAAEVIQAVNKIIRHGYGDINPDQPNAGDNRERLHAELGDMIFSATLMSVAGDISEKVCNAYAHDAVHRKAKYLHHQTNFIELVKESR